MPTAATAAVSLASSPAETSTKRGVSAWTGETVLVPQGSGGMGVAGGVGTEGTGAGWIVPSSVELPAVAGLVSWFLPVSATSMAAMSTLSAESSASWLEVDANLCAPST